MEDKIMHIYKALPGALLPWYEANKRDLPWRRDKDPYHIWISEIMLQQTRVEAVKAYYRRFIDALPTLEDLSNADDGLLHKLWEGLGYYSRVRNLKKAACQIMERHGGVFPEEYEEVLALPGIGPYTAGAICSIAFGKPTPAVDGNVLRVAARLTDDATTVSDPALKNRVQKALASVYPNEAGEFTQALMELGATVCGPNRKPDCESCPCKQFCHGYHSGRAEQLPVHLPKKARRVEEKTVLILSCDGHYAIEKRPQEGLLAGLWQFPNVDGILDVTAVLGRVEELGIKPKEILRTVEKKHIFTHIEWHMYGAYVEVDAPAGPLTWLPAEKINGEIALPTAFRQFWDIL